MRIELPEVKYRRIVYSTALVSFSPLGLALRRRVKIFTATKVIIGQRVKYRQKIVKKVQSPYHLLTSVDRGLMLAMRVILL